MTSQWFSNHVARVPSGVATVQGYPLAVSMSAQWKPFFTPP